MLFHSLAHVIWNLYLCRRWIMPRPLEGVLHTAGRTDHPRRVGVILTTNNLYYVLNYGKR